MKIHVKIESGDGLRTLELTGRQAWALVKLAEAGKRGVTPLEAPALRWSSYVHRIRQRGIHIDTHLEAHGGAFAGRHARYVLATDVEIEVPQ
jgi:hypothetical protein